MCVCGCVHLSCHPVHSVAVVSLSGLGFNIVGGTDQQYMHNDSSIYVSRIKENGAAALDGRLREGDKILEINGNKLENLGHHQAVELFRTAGEDVELRVQQRVSHYCVDLFMLSNMGLRGLQSEQPAPETRHGG
ncbi:SYJ2B protein, partial [Amia calva]|nr:SYJ2B protein [Amia calva]